MLLERELRKLGIFESELPDYIEALADSIPSNRVPYKMKIALAVSEVVRFTSQFKRCIDLGNESFIPVNAITFCLAKSGVGKDSSIRAVTKCFKDSYNKINEIRINKAKQKAINLAREEEKENPESWSVYKQYYVAPNPLEVGISTPEGLVQYLDDISNDCVGSGYVYSGEFSSEMLSNVNLIDNVKILSEVYDEGIKSMKALKDKTKQTEITDVVANALFMSSQDTILYNDMVKTKFKNEFNTKLARRVFFIFVEEDTYKETTDIYAAIAEDRERIQHSNEVRVNLNAFTLELTDQLLETVGTPIPWSPQVEVLYNLYLRYNQEESNKISEIQSPIYKLAREHAHWRALKLAGAFALMDNASEIKEEHYVYAARYAELICNDINKFEKELVKEPYEVFCSYMQENAVEGKAICSLHSLRKLGYIPMKGSPVSKMKELVQLANSYDANGDYALEGDDIHFSAINKTEEIILTYLEVSGSKEDRARHCAKGFVSEQYQFKDLSSMLEGDFAYSPFAFKNGRRGTDYIDSGCKWLVLDIDSSEISDSEAHFLLNDINHYIVRTSDPTNEFKFRVILELDAEVSLHGIQWNSFVKVISEDLGLKVDILPKSQIYFSYSSSSHTLLSTLDKVPLEVKPYLTKVQQISLDGPTPVKTLPKAKKREFLDDPASTFRYAFEARSGRRSISLIRAARHAKDLGAVKEEVLELMESIQNYWAVPLDRNRFEQTIIKQIERWVF